MSFYPVMSQARGIHNREEDLADKADVRGDWSVMAQEVHGVTQTEELLCDCEDSREHSQACGSF